MRSVKSGGHITCRTKGIFRCISFSTGGIFSVIHHVWDGGGHAVAQLVEALHDKVEGRGFDIRGEFQKRRTAHCECNTTYVGFVVSVL